MLYGHTDGCRVYGYIENIYKEYSIDICILVYMGYIYRHIKYIHGYIKYIYGV